MKNIHHVIVEPLISQFARTPGDFACQSTAAPSLSYHPLPSPAAVLMTTLQVKLQ